MRLNIRKLTNRGDTIVEVLIAIAVVSSVMAGAFTVTQKSARAVRDSQERGEMLQELQGQIELVRSIGLSEDAVASGIYNGSPTYFCIDKATKAKHPIGTTLPDGSPYPGACGNLNGLYNVAITYNSSVDTFTFIGSWDRTTGGVSKMQMSYRINP